MGYMLTLDEQREDRLITELRRRWEDRRAGNCDYCHRPRDTATCKERDRHMSPPPAMPQIVVLCGSTKFRREFESTELELGKAGVIVLTVAAFGHDGDLLPEECETGHPVKDALDELHKRKIDLADRVVVIAPGGYVGESTESEIEYAHSTHKEVTVRTEF